MLTDIINIQQLLTPIYCFFQITANALIYFAISLRKARNKTDSSMAITLIKVSPSDKDCFFKNQSCTRKIKISRAYAKLRNQSCILEKSKYAYWNSTVCILIYPYFINVLQKVSL